MDIRFCPLTIESTDSPFASEPIFFILKLSLSVANAIGVGEIVHSIDNSLLDASLNLIIVLLHTLPTDAE